MYKAPGILQKQITDIMSMPQSYKWRLNAVLTCDNRPGKVWVQLAVE